MARVNDRPNIFGKVYDSEADVVGRYSFTEVRPTVPSALAKLHRDNLTKSTVDETDRSTQISE
jgi:hypothetical protein